MKSTYVIERRPISPEQTVAIRRWQWQSMDSASATYRSVQTALRTGGHDLTSTQLRAASGLMDDLNGALERGGLASRSTLFRGVRDLEASLPTLLQASSEFRLRGFVATTRSLAVIEEFIPKRGTILALNAPAELPAIDVARHGHSELQYQREILLPSDLIARVTGYGRGKDLFAPPALADRMVVYLDVR